MQITIDGHCFTGIESKRPGRCGDCTFKDGFGCQLEVVTGGALSLCHGKHRADGHSFHFFPSHLAAKVAQRQGVLNGQG